MFFFTSFAFQLQLNKLYFDWHHLWRCLNCLDTVTFTHLLLWYDLEKRRENYFEVYNLIQTWYTDTENWWFAALTDTKFVYQQEYRIKKLKLVVVEKTACLKLGELLKSWYFTGGRATKCYVPDARSGRPAVGWNLSNHDLFLNLTMYFCCVNLTKVRLTSFFLHTWKYYSPSHKRQNLHHHIQSPTLRCAASIQPTQLMKFLLYTIPYDRFPGTQMWD